MRSFDFRSMALPAAAAQQPLIQDSTAVLAAVVVTDQGLHLGLEEVEALAVVAAMDMEPGLEVLAAAAEDRLAERSVSAGLV
jgi:hypothetical protein